MALKDNNGALLTDEMRIVTICDNLKITYTELCSQPAWWVNNYLVLNLVKSKITEIEANKLQSRG